MIMKVCKVYNLQTDPQVVSINEDHWKWGRFSHSLTAHLEFLPIFTVQSDVLLYELDTVVLKDLPDKLTSLERSPDHSKTGGVDYNSPKL